MAGADQGDRGLVAIGGGEVTDTGVTVGRPREHGHPALGAARDGDHHLVAGNRGGRHRESRRIRILLARAEGGRCRHRPRPLR